MERQRPIDRAYSPGQIAHIRTYEMIGRSLAGDLTRAPELRDEISGLLHSDPTGRERIYEGIIRHYFNESGRDFRSQVESPFVRSFEGTPLCDEEETNFLDALRNLASTTSTPPEDLVTDFQEWLERRLPVMAKGLQSCVLDTGVIPPLTPEEILRRSSELMKRRWAENPDAYVEFQRLGTQAAAENAGPKVFTEEVRGHMQRWFDKDIDYETTVELLRGLGIETHETVVRSAVQRYPDLHYTPAENQKQLLEGYKSAMRDIFDATNSPVKTREILAKLGYSPAKTQHWLSKMDLRNRTYWDREVNLEGQPKRLDELMVEFAKRNFPTVKEEYEAVKAYLEENGVNVRFSFNAYDTSRRKIVGKRTTTS